MYKIKNKIIKISECQYNKLIIDDIKKNNSPSLIMEHSFGNPIQEDLRKLYNGYLTEGYYKTYPVDNVVDYIGRMLGERGVIGKNERGSHAVIVVKYIPNETTSEQLDKAFGLCGYYKSHESKENNGLAKCDYEPRYPDNVDNYVRNVGVLFHITKLKHVDKILKYGLSPRSNNEFFKYPDRIYFLNGNASDDLIFNTAKMLAYGITNNGISNKDATSKEWAILGINTKILPYDIKFYADTTMFNGYSVFTYDNIHPSAIELIDTIVIPNLNRR